MLIFFVFYVIFIKVINGGIVMSFTRKINNGGNVKMNNSSSQNMAKKIIRLSLLTILGILVIILLYTSFYTIKEQQQGVLHTFGKPVSVVDSGLHFKIPLVQTVKKVDATTHGFAIGFDESTNQSTEEAGMITSDFNFVNVDFFVEWKVSDPIKSLYTSQNAELVLNNCTLSAAKKVVGGTTVDDVLTVGKGEIQSAIKEIVMAKLEELDLGIQLVNITIQDAEPPTAEIMSAFKSVENAKQEKDTAINNANKYNNEKIPDARAKSDKITQDAEAQKASRINSATGQVARFNEMFAEYIKNPDITKKRLFFETMEEIMPGIEVVIESGDSTQKIYPVAPFTEGK